MSLIPLPQHTHTQVKDEEGLARDGSASHCSSHSVLPTDVERLHSDARQLTEERKLEVKFSKYIWRCCYSGRGGPWPIKERAGMTGNAQR